jgi:uncharacterized membrane protein
MESIQDNNKTNLQRIIRFTLILASGLILITLSDLYGFSISNKLNFSNVFLFIFNLVTITVCTFIASRFIGKKTALWISTILTFFEISIGQIIFIESSNGKLQEPWPPIYFISIIIYTTIFYFITRLINRIVWQNRTP